MHFIFIANSGNFEIYRQTKINTKINNGNGVNGGQGQAIDKPKKKD